MTIRYSMPWRTGDAAAMPARLDPRRVPAPARQPVSAASAPAAASAMIASSAPALKLVVRGFNPVELKLLEATVKLSLRRTPQLHLLAEAEVDSADVVMVDARDPQAMAWARTQQACFERKAVIWVDGESAGRGHTLARRPVQWPILPMMLARALEKGPGTVSNRAADGGRPAGPATDAGSAIRSHAAAPPAAAVARPVLIVDDSLAVRGYLRSQLESRGFQVAEVAGAQEALDAMSRAAFACVLMDVLMPGMDGYEGCKQIKARLRGVASVPVIMLTSRASPFDRIRGKMAGCDAYLTKPIDPKQLHEVLAQHRVIPANAGTHGSAPARAQAQTACDS